jgi:hypothetical protein
VNGSPGSISTDLCIIETTLIQTKPLIRGAVQLTRAWRVCSEYAIACDRVAGGQSKQVDVIDKASSCAAFSSQLSAFVNGVARLVRAVWIVERERQPAILNAVVPYDANR